MYDAKTRHKNVNKLNSAPKTLRFTSEFSCHSPPIAFCLIRWYIWTWDAAFLRGMLRIVCWSHCLTAGQTL